MLDNYPDVLSFRQVMEITHVGRNLLLRLLNSGEIPAFKMGKPGRFTSKTDPVYEPMSVSLIFRLGQKNPVGLRSRNPAGFDSIDPLMCSSQISRRILRLALTSKLYLGTVVCCDSHYFIDIRLRFIVRFRIASALPS